MSRNYVAAPIEHFVWTHLDPKQDKLIYFDQNGQQFEREVDHRTLEETLKLFDGKKRAIRRSAGGLISAEPFQLVLFDSEDPTKPGKLGVRVRFMDLRRDYKNIVTGKEVFLHTKIVPAQELKDGFILDLETKQPLLADFGKGLIPIHVYQYAVDENGMVQAHFVLANALDHIAHLPQAESYKIQSYRMIRDAIRLPDPEANFSEANAAKDNAEWQFNTGETVIPECLVDGAPLEIPGGTVPELTENLLRLALDPKGEEFLEPIFINIRKNEESALIPFGAFER